MDTSSPTMEIFDELCNGKYRDDKFMVLVLLKYSVVSNLFAFCTTSSSQNFSIVEHLTLMKP